MTSDLSRLHRFIVERLSLDELRTLCFDLSVDYENLPGETKAAKARELILQIGREHQLGRLLITIAQVRPDLAGEAILQADPEALDALRAALPAFEDTSVPEPSTPGESPFKGLQYFDVTDAHLFFGREGLTANLLGRLREQRFLAVVGASGSGKSSVVRAGLIPALQRSEPLADDTLPPDGSAHWPVHVITPTAHPVRELAASLTRDSESVTATATLMDDLSRDARSLDLAVSRLLKQTGSGRRLLLVVDQFEELFTACKDTVERQAFVDNLLTAIAPETDSSTVLVVALRADFYAHCGQYDHLRAALEQCQAYIGPMTQDELRQAIEEPAARNGWEFEPGLVDLMLRDVGDEPGALPLLSHALLETWKRRQGHTMTLAGYHEAGGVHGAIARTAETVYHQRLTPEQQAIARTIFLRLTELGEGTQDTRCRADLAELVPRPEDALQVEAVLKILADARLVTTGEEVAEVAHEALIREWPTLRRWLDEDREALRVFRRLSVAAQEWHRYERDASFLFRGTRLFEAEEWAATNRLSLNEMDRTFLNASVREREKERITARRRVQRVIAGLAFAVLIFAGLALFAFQERNDAIKSEAAALSRQLAAQAKVALDQDPELALLLSLEVWQRVQKEGLTLPLGTEVTLRQALTDYHLRHKLFLNADGIGALAFSPDGTYLATASSTYTLGQDDVTIEIWDVLTGQRVEDTLLHGLTSMLAFSPDNSLLAISLSISDDAQQTSIFALQVWDIFTGDKVAQLENSLVPFRQAVFSSDREQLISLNANWAWQKKYGQRVAIWNLTNQELEWELSAPVVALSANGKRAALLQSDGIVQVWDIVARQQVFTTSSQSLLDHPAGVLSQIALNFDGTVVAVNDQQSVKWWDVNSRTAFPSVLASDTEDIVLSASGQRLALVYDRRIEVYGIDGNLLSEANFDELDQDSFRYAIRTAQSPDSKKLAVSPFDDTVVRLWDFEQDGVTAELRGHTENIFELAFNLDSSILATGSADGVVHLWDATGTTGQHWLSLGGHQGGTRYMAFSPTGDPILATVSQQDVVVLWDLTTGSQRARLYGNRIAFHPNGHILAASDTDGRISLWDVQTGEMIATAVAHPRSKIDFLAFSLDGAYLFSASNGDGSLRTWDVESLNSVNTVVLEGTIVDSPDTGKRHLITVDDHQNTRLWNAFEGEVMPFDCSVDFGGYLMPVAFHPFSDIVVVGTPDDDYGMPVCSTATGHHLFTLYGRGDLPIALAFDPSGGRFAAVTWQGAGIANASIELWDLAKQHQVAQFDVRGSGEPMLDGFGLSPGGQRMVAGLGGEESILGMWDVASGEMVGRLSPHNKRVSIVQFSPTCISLPFYDGQRCIELVATAGEGLTVILDLVNPEDLAISACRRLNRNMTQGEWQRYLDDEPYRETCPGNRVPDWDD